MINLLLSLLLLSWAPPCEAGAVCRCRPDALEEAMRSADGVFTATVVSVSEGEGRLGQRVRLRAHAAWKGVDSAEAVVVSSGTSCDHHFAPGERYLVVGSRLSDGAFHTNYCMGTRRIERGKEMLQALGTPVRTWPER